MKKRGSLIYQTITGRTFELNGMNKEEREFISAVYESYKQFPGWNKFSTWWIDEFDRVGLDEKSPVYRICQDLEARLGIAQGKVAPPDYRDYLADLIEVKYGSRYKFCKETGIDPGQLSRVFGGRSDLSLPLLQSILRRLGAVLVIQPEADLQANASLEKVSHALGAVA